jgi:hypothetical protein
MWAVRWKGLPHPQTRLRLTPLRGMMNNDFDVLANGKVVGRILKVNAAPVGSPWMWTLAFGYHRDRAPNGDARGRYGCIRQELAARMIFGPARSLRRAKDAALTFHAPVALHDAHSGGAWTRRGQALRHGEPASVPPEPSCHA